MPDHPAADDKRFLSKDAAVYFRDEFKRARAQAFRDVENTQAVFFVLERLGSVLTNKFLGLGQFKDSICEVANRSPLAEGIPRIAPESHLSFSDLYDSIRMGRNDAMH